MRRKISGGSPSRDIYLGELSKYPLLKPQEEVELAQQIEAAELESLHAALECPWVARQLEDGIRGLLIDAHYGFPVGDKVKTDLADEKAAIAKYEAALGSEGLEAVLRIRDRLAGQKLGDRDVYMCHGFCELGALKLVPVLSEIREFLVANPGEVLIVVIQDESVTPRDIERCFQESGLIDFVYRGPARPPWPTLRAMVETDQRVHIYGTEGRISIGIPFNIPPDRPTHVFVTAGGDPPVAPDTETLTFETADPYTVEAEEMAAIVLDGAQPSFPLADAVANLRVMEAIFRIGDSGT